MALFKTKKKYLLVSFELDESVGNKSLRSRLRFSEMFLLSWKENYAPIFLVYIFDFILQERFKNRFYAHVNPHWGPRHRLGELLEPATAICMLFPKIKSPPREKRTKSGFRPLRTSLRTVSFLFKRYKLRILLFFPSVIFKIDIKILHHTHFRLNIKRKKFFTRLLKTIPNIFLKFLFQRWYKNKIILPIWW